MIPLRDVNATRRVPVVTLFLIGMNVSVYLVGLQLSRTGVHSLGHAFTSIPDAYADLAITPAAIRGCFPLCRDVNVWLSLLNSMFLHASVLHLAINMFYLWLFGNNVEDKLGRFQFVVFYLVAGASASLVYSIAPGSLDAPLVGASGAIAGSLGAYLLLFPRVRMTTVALDLASKREAKKALSDAGAMGQTKATLLSLVAVDIPAWIVLVIYFVLQFAMKYLGSLGGGNQVAYTAHVAGFLAGIVQMVVFDRKQIDPGIRRRFHLDRARDHNEPTASP